MSEFSYRNFKRFALDLDGTMLDSRAMHDEARIEAYGIISEETGDERYAAVPLAIHQEAHLHGSNPYSINGWILRAVGIVTSEDYARDPKTVAVVKQRDITYADKLAQGGMPMPGAVPFVRRLSTHAPGRLAVVTTASRTAELMPFLSQNKLHRYFRDDMLVTKEDVEQGREKPDPLAYEILLQRTGLSAAPELALAVEDSKHGIESAKRAGLTLIALAGTHTLEELKEIEDYQPDGIAENMEHLSEMLGIAA